MTDYIEQCNAATVEEKVWRWERYDNCHRGLIVLRREDRRLGMDLYGDWTSTEYLGDADGNPIPAMLGPQELWDRHGLHIHPNYNSGWDLLRKTPADLARYVSTHDTYAAALAEANRIAGGAAVLKD